MNNRINIFANYYSNSRGIRNILSEKHCNNMPISSNPDEVK